MKIKVLRQMVHLKHFLFNQGVQNGVFTALLCFVTVGGFMLFTGDGLQSLSSVPTRHYGQSSYTGATGYSVASGSGVPVVSHSTLGHGISGGSGVSGSTGGAGYSGLSGGTGVAVSTGMIGHTTKISSVAFGGGGGVYGGGGGGSGSSGGSGGTGSSGSSGRSGVSGLSGFSGISGFVALSSRVGDSSPIHSDPMGAWKGDPSLGEYTGDAPGVITSDENAVLDNTIITSYGQPIGDVLWPLLLMAMVYALWVGKRYLRRNI